MDMNEKKYGMEHGDQEHLSYPQSGISADWRFGNPQATSMVAAHTSMPQGHQMDSFCPTLWDHPPNSQSLGFPETNAAHDVLVRKPVPGSSMVGMGGGMLLQTPAGVLPPGFSQFPADSAFIERAARFSCFGGGDFGAIVSHFGLNHQPVDPYLNATKPDLGAQPQKNDVNTGEASKDNVAVNADHGSVGGSPMTSQKGVGVPGNESAEAELSGSGQEENLNSETPPGEPSSKTLAAKKKRKRNTQEMEIDESRVDSGQSVEDAKENVESKLKAEKNNSTVATIKPNRRQGKDITEPPKEDYIHVRARRGQATNSHSLAERVRREKISERMKFLQDLVPGCSKVTGKAVMLDEIINYVQSLQRQVEFLSMKLATVNPQLDFNIEGLLSKDILQCRSSLSSTVGFLTGMAHPLTHQNAQGLVQSEVSGMGAPSDALRRAINAQMTSMHTFKESRHQMSNAWDEEFHSEMQVGFVGNPPLNIQDLNSKNQDGFPL